MHSTLFDKRVSAIRRLNLVAITTRNGIPEEFLLGQADRYAVAYTPFDYVNSSARLAIVGVTPGFTQWKNAMFTARGQLLAGATNEQAAKAAKSAGAFSGAMRKNLINLLDFFKVNRWLGITSASELFGPAAHLVQTTSVLRHATFIDWRDYNGQPNMLRSPLLRAMLLEHFAQEVRQLPHAYFISLGDKVAKVLHWLADEGVIARFRIIDGLIHPSGASAERVAYTLGRKAREDLSSRSNADILDECAARFTRNIARLPTCVDAV